MSFENINFIAKVSRSWLAETLLTYDITLRGSMLNFCEGICGFMTRLGDK